MLKAEIPVQLKLYGDFLYKYIYCFSLSFFSEIVYSAACGLASFLTLAD